MTNLTIGDVINNSIKIGLKNFGSIIGAVLLWLITVWIPYLNVGTTIALVGMVVALSKGTVMSPTEIFDPKYRKNMGEFFLLLAFLWVGIMAGYAFVIIPGIVISIAWGQAIYLLIDKDMSPTEAIKASNRITYGKKWIIFLSNLILAVIMIVGISIVTYIVSIISDALAAIVGLIGYIGFFVVMLAAAAYIYGELSKELDEPAA